MNHLITPVLCLLIGLSAHATLPSKSTFSAAKAIETLKLPPAERHQAFASQPDAVYDVLMKVSADGEEAMDTRWRALTSAAMLRKDRATSDLMKATQSEAWYLRNAALVSLAEFAPEQALQAARALVKDSALVVRSAAVDVIDKIGGEQERSLLWTELAQSYNRRGQQSLWIRPQIVRLLAKKPKADELKKFTALLADADESIRVAASEGLDQISDRKPAATTRRASKRR